MAYCTKQGNYNFLCDCNTCQLSTEGHHIVTVKEKAAVQALNSDLLSKSFAQGQNDALNGHKLCTPLNDNHTHHYETYKHGYTSIVESQKQALTFWKSKSTETKTNLQPSKRKCPGPTLLMPNDPQFQMTNDPNQNVKIGVAKRTTNDSSSDNDSDD